MYRINLKAASRNSTILIKQGLLSDGATIKQQLDRFRCHRIMLISNQTVMDNLGDKIALPDHLTTLIGDGEQYKNHHTLNQIYDSLLACQCGRDTLIIACGGGVVGDIAGFAAATYQRGIPLVQIPTTLLAQVDSSVGGKTAINHPLGKNMIGAFYQPSLVLIDPDVLATLPPRESRAGLAEIVKYALIRDAEFGDWLLDNHHALDTGNPAALAHAIHTSCLHKTAIVTKDEREQGERALLNLGHTFGHAIEKYQQYQGWLHGEAVALGLRIATDLSHAIHWLDSPGHASATRLLNSCQFPDTLPAGLDAKTMMDIMLLDKKNLAANIRLILLKDFGKAAICDQLSKAQITDLLKQILQKYTR